MATNVDRVIQLSSEISKLTERIAVLKLELGALVAPDKRSPGRPPADGDSLASKIERMLVEAAGALSTSEIRSRLGANRKTVSATLSYMHRKKPDVVEKVSKGVYQLKK